MVRSGTINAVDDEGNQSGPPAAQTGWIHTAPPPSSRGGRLGEREQTHLHPVGEPVAFGVGALHGEQDVAPRDDAPLWDRLDLDGQVSLVFL